MELKIIKDRLNHMKSYLQELKTPKLAKNMSDYYFQIEETKGRIKELEWLIYKIEDGK